MNNRIFKRAVSLGVLCCMSVILASGCSPAMRKKFVRQKKKEEDRNLVPVLEPVDYPDRLKSVKTRYEYFYALLKVWHKDALMLLDDNPSDKQITYAIRQIALQLAELEKILAGESRQKTAEGRKRVEAILAYYKKPAAFRSRDIIRKSLQRLTKSVIRPLDYDMIKDDLKGQYESVD